MSELKTNNQKPNITAKDLPINITTIMASMPHRYPFLLIDRIVDYNEDNKYLRAIKNVTINEPFFIGHFPDYPVMPGVLIVEAMAQAAGVLSVLTNGYVKKNELYFFAGIENAKFKRQVIPGDTLKIDITLVRLLQSIGKYNAKVYVEDKLASSADILIAKKNF